MIFQGIFVQILPDIAHGLRSQINFAENQMNSVASCVITLFWRTSWKKYFPRDYYKNIIQELLIRLYTLYTLIKSCLKDVLVFELSTI